MNRSKGMYFKAHSSVGDGYVQDKGYTSATELRKSPRDTCTCNTVF